MRLSGQAANIAALPDPTAAGQARKSRPLRHSRRRSGQNALGQPLRGMEGEDRFLQPAARTWRSLQDRAPHRPLRMHQYQATVDSPAWLVVPWATRATRAACPRALAPRQRLPWR
ncbi:unnamed protein product [Effrenium voratum]|nr:unnamed protein product [Effrenium voratum]